MSFKPSILLAGTAAPFLYYAPSVEAQTLVLETSNQAESVVAVADGYYVSQMDGGQVLKYNLDWTLDDSFVSGSLSNPRGLAVNGDGTKLWAACNNYVAEFTLANGVVQETKQYGTLSQDVTMQDPNGLCLSPDEQILYFTSPSADTFAKIDLTAAEGDEAVSVLVTDPETAPNGCVVTDDNTEVYIINQSTGIMSYNIATGVMESTGFSQPVADASSMATITGDGIALFDGQLYASTWSFLGNDGDIWVCPLDGSGDCESLLSTTKAADLSVDMVTPSAPQLLLPDLLGKRVSTYQLDGSDYTPTDDTGEPFVCQLCDGGASFTNPATIVEIPGIDATLASFSITDVVCGYLTMDLVIGNLNKDECDLLKTFASPPCKCPGDDFTDEVYVSCSGACLEPFTDPGSAIPELSAGLMNANCGDIYDFTQENQLTQEQCELVTEAGQNSCECPSFECQLCDGGAAFTNPTDIVVIPGIDSYLSDLSLTEVQCQYLSLVLGELSEDECINLKTLASPPCFCPGDETDPVYVSCSSCSEPYTNPDTVIPELSNSFVNANCGDIYDFNQENQLTQEQCEYTEETIRKSCLCVDDTVSPTVSTTAPTGAPFVCQMCDGGQPFVNPDESVVIPGSDLNQCAMLSEPQLLASLSEDECIALKMFASPPCLCPFENAVPVYVPCSGCSEPYTNPDSVIPEFSGDQISANCGDIYAFTEENQLTQEQCNFVTEPVQSTCVCEAPTGSADVTSAPTSSSSVVSFVFGVAGVLFGTVIMMV